MHSGVGGCGDDETTCEPTVQRQYCVHYVLEHFRRESVATCEDRRKRPAAEVQIAAWEPLYDEASFCQRATALM